MIINILALIMLYQRIDVASELEDRLNPWSYLVHIIGPIHWRRALTLTWSLLTSARYLIRGHSKGLSTSFKFFVFIKELLSGRWISAQIDPSKRLLMANSLKEEVYCHGFASSFTALMYLTWSRDIALGAKCLLTKRLHKNIHIHAHKMYMNLPITEDYFALQCAASDLSNRRRLQLPI